MPAFKDLSGQRFGRLVVVGPHPERTKYKMIRWICRCDCGNEKLVTAANIGGNTNSCGCFRNTQGGLTRKHPLWARWNSMIERCELEGAQSYHNYGARGISVCDRWHSFKFFLEDMEASFYVGATLDRFPDNDGNYEPNNCRWATTKQQSRNKRRSIMIDSPWGIMNIAEAAEKIGMNRDMFKTRVKLGWTTEQLFDPRNRRRFTKHNSPNAKAS